MIFYVYLFFPTQTMVCCFLVNYCSKLVFMIVYDGEGPEDVGQTPFVDF